MLRFSPLYRRRRAGAPACRQHVDGHVTSCDELAARSFDVLHPLGCHIVCRSFGESGAHHRVGGGRDRGFCAGTAGRTDSGPRTAIERTAPAKAYALLEALQRRNGEPLAGYVGGKVFQNRERRLPRGRYKEYDVNRKVPGRSRDAERLVIEQDTGKAYYTDDHYRTFFPLN